MDQKAHEGSDGRFWYERATRVIEEARKMPPGEQRRAAIREAERLRVAAEVNRWLSAKQSARTG